MSPSIPTTEADDLPGLMAQLRDAGRKVGAQADALTLAGAFFESTPFPAWIKTVATDQTTAIMHINRACERVTGWNAVQAVGLTALDVTSPEALARAHESDLTLLQTGTPQRVDIVVINRRTGAPTRLIGWKWIVPSNGPAIAICGFAQEFPIP